MSVLSRFLSYVNIPTQSDEYVPNRPTNLNELRLGEQLAEEMRELGLTVDEKDARYGYFYGCLPATPGYEDICRIGFIAHMDTAPACSGENIKPRVIENYDGSDIVLGDSGKVLSAEQFPHLPSLKGRTLVVTDGTTLLGADDKAGIAEIMTALEYIVKNNIPHGYIAVAFTPDEEIGIGTDSFDIDRFGADLAYTVDGGEEWIVENENFNAEMVYLTVTGFAVHPGDAKGIMINALSAASRLNFMFDMVDMTPRESEGRDGFHYLVSMTGDPNEVTMAYALRDFEEDALRRRRFVLDELIHNVNALYGTDVIRVSKDVDQYFNMRDRVPDEIVDTALSVISELGMEADTKPVRGGTDGAMLSCKGLPCPNLGTGGYAYHGPYEHITVEGMEAVVRIIVGIVRSYAGRSGEPRC